MLCKVETPRVPASTSALMAITRRMRRLKALPLPLVVECDSWPMASSRFEFMIRA
jgi:hypothetical protein